MKIKIDSFNPYVIANSGQCFRMNMVDEKVCHLIAKDKFLEIKRISNDEYEFSCDKKTFDSFFYEYFDLNNDYKKYKRVLKKDDIFLKNCILYSKGLRILKQDKFETLISFIISQRKSIPAIKTSIERICESCGEKKKYKNITYYTFPSPFEIYKNKEKLKSCGLGYRLPYIVEVCKNIIDKRVDLEKIDKMTNEELLSELMKIKGVGIKVASCVALFAYRRIDICPIDVWISRVLNSKYNGEMPREYKKYAGIIQQYWFYYAKDHKVF